AAMTRTRIPEPLHQPLIVLPLLLLLILPLASRTTVGVALQGPSQRFFYAASAASTASAGSGAKAASGSSQTKVRLLREVEEVVPVASEGSCCQAAAAAAAKPLSFNWIPIECRTPSNWTNKTSVSFAAAVRNATPAGCSPQPTIVELKPPAEEGSDFYYTPACTRINRCNGCCGSMLISCQPTETEIVQLRVRKVDRSGAGARRLVAIVDVEQHLTCKCDCRIKAEDCNAYQSYRADLCRCECHNTDAKDKCLEQPESKYWDDANCTCACRYNQSCTTGTVFDETQCKCTDPSAPISVLDRKRFIVQAVQVDPDNTTLYSL
ncbi:hypothetical protein KR018_006753, partial [Drosophila ironensis]